jgi:hypothetical protein
VTNSKSEKTAKNHGKLGGQHQLLESQSSSSHASAPYLQISLSEPKIVNLRHRMIQFI